MIGWGVEEIPPLSRLWYRLLPASIGLVFPANGSARPADDDCGEGDDPADEDAGSDVAPAIGAEGPPMGGDSPPPVSSPDSGFDITLDDVL